MTQPITRWSEVTRSVWKAFDPDAETSEAAARAACIVRLIVLTLQKPQQVANMTVRSVDLDGRLWLVSASDAVGRHILPLTPLAANLIKTALALRDDTGSPWVFQDRGRARIGDVAIHRHFNARMRTTLPFEAVRLNDLRYIGRMLRPPPR